MTIAADYTTSREPIHHAQQMGFAMPTTCGKTDVPKPMTPEWRWVGCPRCLALKPAEFHARPSADAPALCGAAPDVGEWTAKRSKVTCGRCLDEVCRREGARREEQVRRRG